VYVVPIQVSVFRTPIFGGRTPRTDLVVADFRILLDKREYAPVDVTPEPDRPGSYLLNFTPPDVAVV
jgi:hypothetical protein